MQRILTVCAMLGLSAALVGCGGETPKPPVPNTETELGAPSSLENTGDTLEGAPDPLGSGSSTGAPEALPPVSTPGDPAPAADAPAGDQPAAAGENATTEGPALPKIEK